MPTDTAIGGGQQDVAHGLNAAITKLGAYTQAMEQTGKNFVAAVDMQQRFGDGSIGSVSDARRAVAQTTRDFTAGQTKAAPKSGSDGRTIGTLGGIQQGVTQNATTNLLAGQTRNLPLGAGGGGGGGGVGGSSGGGSLPGTPGAGSPFPPGGGGGGGHPGGGGGGRPPGPGQPGGPGGGPSGGPAPGGQGASSGIMDSITKNIPFVGTVNDIIAEVRSQRNKNAYYQNIEGGSNFAGFGERIREEGYRWQTMGLYNEEEARQAYKGVTRIGYNSKAGDQYNNSRRGALNFVAAGKTQYGGSVEESLSALEVASRDSRISLGQLSKALKDVSDTAGKAGVNAEMMRKQLINTLSVATTQGYGSGAVAYARSSVETQSSYGRSFSNTDFTGRMSQQYEYMVAGRAGMSQTQYVNLQNSNPTAAAQLRTTQDLSIVNQLFSSQEQAWVKAQAQKYGGATAVKNDPNLVAKIAQDFYRQFPQSHPNMDADAAQLAMYSGGTLDRSNAVQWAIQQMIGNTEGAQAAQDQALSGQHKTDSASLNKFVSGQATADKSIGGVIKSGISGLGAPISISPSLGKALGIQTPGTPGAAGAATLSKAEQAYVDLAKTGGKQYGAIEQLLTSLKSKGTDIDSLKVVVSAYGGKREMSLADAIKNFPNEVAAGQVTFSTGDMKGQTSGDVAGATDTGANWTGEAQDKGKANVGKAYTGTLPTSDGKSNVIVDLSDEAKKILKIVSWPSGLITGASATSATSTTPPNPTDVVTGRLFN